MFRALRRRPDLPSVGSGISAFIGMSSATAALILLTSRPVEDIIVATFLLLAAYAVPVAAYEIFVRKVHLKPTTGLDWTLDRPVHWNRVAIKFLGLVGVIGLLCLFHTFIRFYPIYRVVTPWDAVLKLAPFAAPVIFAYMAAIDRRMVQPEDGYCKAGRLLLLDFREENFAGMKDFALGWIIKGIFWPIMFTYLAYNLPDLHFNRPQLGFNPVMAVLYVSSFIIALELTVVVTGYTTTFRVFDSHIRSANPFLVAWVVTLICYEPFSYVSFGQIFEFQNQEDWVGAIWRHPNLMYPWLAGIVASYILWIWATAMFGLRWSNLTNRGIVTNGPYRFTKHPDYFAKSVFFWFTAVPFFTAMDTRHAITGTIALIITNLVYYGRARVEEMHLSEDPDYVEYALLMNRYSVFAPLARVLPFMVYRAPDGRTALEDEPPAMAAGVPGE